MPLRCRPGNLVASPRLFRPGQLPHQEGTDAAGQIGRRRKYDPDHDAFSRPALPALIASGGLPDEARQPTKIQLHITLDELARLQQASEPAGVIQADTETGDAPAARPDQGSFGPTATPGDACDATIVPIVTGRVDHDLLDRLTAKLTSQASDNSDRGTIRDIYLGQCRRIAFRPGPTRLFSHQSS